MERQTGADLTMPTDEQAKILLQTFNQMKGHLTQHGLSLFIRLFSEFPDYKDIWPQFRQIVDSSLMYSGELQAHVANYMRGLGVVINALAEKKPDVLAVQMKTIARTHARRNVNKQHIMHMLPQWLEVMRSAEVEVNDEVEAAWRALYHMLSNSLERLKKDPLWMSTSTASTTSNTSGGSIGD